VHASSNESTIKPAVTQKVRQRTVPEKLISSPCVVVPVREVPDCGPAAGTTSDPLVTVGAGKEM
jgi:hypothetical protein